MRRLRRFGRARRLKGPWLLAGLGFALTAAVLLARTERHAFPLGSSSMDVGANPTTLAYGVPPATRSDCPAGYPIKGNINAGGAHIFHVPGGAFYTQTNPERCFAAPADAAQAGFRPAQR
jgi:hypothetical protein